MKDYLIKSEIGQTLFELHPYYYRHPKLYKERTDMLLTTDNVTYVYIHQSGYGSLTFEDRQAHKYRAEGAQSGVYGLLHDVKDIPEHELKNLSLEVNVKTEDTPMNTSPNETVINTNTESVNW